MSSKAEAKARHVVTTLALASVVFDHRLQSRVGLNMDTLEEYIDALEAGAVLPAVDVYRVGCEIFLADGWHRAEAARRTGRKSIQAHVYEGTFDDALAHATGANVNHGLRPTNADKRKAVNMMLDHKTFVGWASRKIARHCGVSVTLVSKMRKEREDEAKKEASGVNVYNAKTVPVSPVANSADNSESVPHIPWQGDDDALAQIDQQVEAGDSWDDDDIPWDAWEPVDDAEAEEQDVEAAVVVEAVVQVDDDDTKPIPDMVRAIFAANKHPKLSKYLPLIGPEYIGEDISGWILDGGKRRLLKALEIVAVDEGRAKHLSPLGAWETFEGYLQQQGYELRHTGGGGWMADLGHLLEGYWLGLIGPGIEGVDPAWQGVEDGDELPMVTLVRIMRLLWPPTVDEGAAVVASAPAPAPEEDEVTEIDGWRVEEVGYLKARHGVHPPGTRAEVEGFEGGRVVVKLNGKGERKRVRSSEIERRQPVVAPAPRPIKAWEAPALVERPAELHTEPPVWSKGVRVRLHRDLGVHPGGNHPAMEAGREGVVDSLVDEDGHLWVVWDGEDSPELHLYHYLEEVVEEAPVVPTPYDAGAFIMGVFRVLDDDIHKAQLVLADHMDGMAKGSKAYRQMTIALNKVKDLREFRTQQRA